MREIKFRGKSKNVNEWCYGTYIFSDDNTNNPFRTGPFKESHRIVFWVAGDWNMGGWDNEEVIPETIGQYTGLKDKNGKEIYEGDILTWSRNGIESSLLVIEYKHGAFGYTYSEGCFYALAGNFNFTFNPFDNDNRFQIIGNIHDNPELIKRNHMSKMKPAYDCKYIGLGENCHLHSGLTEHGHTQMGCSGKCKDYRKKRIKAK